MMSVNLGDAGQRNRVNHFLTIYAMDFYARKKMPNRKNSALIVFVLMLSGLFWSRALLSFTQAAWIIWAMVYYKEWKSLWKKDALLIWSICPILLFFTGCWQTPLALANYDYLLTLSVYPATAVAVRTTQSLSIHKKWLQVWMIATLAGIAYPLGYFIMNMAGSVKAYGAGQSLPTFMDTDHVRFGIFLCSSFLFLLAYRLYKAWMQKLFIAFLFITILFLSVRTAWVILLLIALIFPLVFFSAQKKIMPVKILALFTMTAVLVFLSYYLFPTMQQKIAYSIYDWQQYRPGNYDATFSDGTRRAINHAAWNAIQQQFNTGWASVPLSLQQSFTQLYPAATLSYGWPFNQFFFWWMGSGWWGMLLFLAWLIYPLVWGLKNRNPGLVCWTIAITASCLVESNLCQQYGVFLHAWPIAFLWAINHKNEAVVT